MMIIKNLDIIHGQKKEMNRLIASEHDIQNAIYGYLGALGWLVWRNNSGMVKTDKGYMIKMGRAGLPDLFALKDGILLGVEVKKPGKKPTEIQEYMLQDLQKHGAQTIVATSIDDVTLKLTELERKI